MGPAGKLESSFLAGEMTGTLKAMNPVTVAPTRPKTIFLILSIIPMGMPLVGSWAPVEEGSGCQGARVVNRVGARRVVVGSREAEVRVGSEADGDEEKNM